MRFSLLVPSRGRTYSLTRLLDSLNFTTNDSLNIEILFAVDKDDAETINHLQNIITSKQYLRLPHLRLLTRDQSEFLNRDYYNWMAEQAQGDFLWAIGDDVVFQVSNWDGQIFAQLEGYLKDKKDRVVGAGIRDNTPKPKPTLPQFPCFPLVSKEAFRTMGFMLHPNIPTWGADYLFYLLYYGVNRYLPIENEVYLLHMSIHTKTAPKDETATRIEKIFNQLKMNQDYNIDRTAELIIPQQIREFQDKINKLQ